MAVIPMSCWIWITASSVLRRVEPPAPHVTDTKSGSRRFRSSTVRYSDAKPLSVLGGKNSNEKTGRSRVKSSAMRMGLVYH